MLAAASPLPSEDTTPPVMKMYFGFCRSVMILVSSGSGRALRLRRVAGSVRLSRDLSTRRRRRQQAPHLLEILGCVDAERFVLRFHGFDADAMFERAQLLE